MCPRLEPQAAQSMRRTVSHHLFEQLRPILEQLAF